MILLLLSDMGVFISFSCLIALARTFIIMLNTNGKSGHLCLDHTGKSFNLLPEYDVSYGLVIDDLYYAKEHSFYTQFDEHFHHDMMLYLSNTFSASVEMIISYLSFILLMWCITFVVFHVLNHPCIPGINLT